jgi:hypothetical protein
MYCDCHCCDHRLHIVIRDSDNTNDGIHKPVYFIENSHLKEIEEKAKKYDDALGGFSAVTHTIIESKTLGEYMTKANKWDLLCIEASLSRNDETKLTTKELIHQWKEKAKNWDEFQGMNPNNIPHTINKWKEKAKKWDEFINSPNVITNRPEWCEEIMDKAKKWDEIQKFLRMQERS